jgi:hypothetical protein
MVSSVQDERGAGGVVGVAVTVTVFVAVEEAGALDGMLAEVEAGVLTGSDTEGVEAGVENDDGGVEAVVPVPDDAHPARDAAAARPARPATSARPRRAAVTCRSAGRSSTAGSTP